VRAVNNLSQRVWNAISPRRARSISYWHPRLAPWAAFLRRFAAATKGSASGGNFGPPNFLLDAKIGLPVA